MMGNTSRVADLRGRRGFTMVELLVALAISSFIIVTVYFVMASSSTTFRVQNDLAQVSDRLNYSLDTIKNDLRRSSFMTMPNLSLPADRYPWFETVCGAPTWFTSSGATGQGLAVWTDAVATSERDNGMYVPARPRDQIVPGENPDRFVMLGSFRAEEPFHPTLMQSGSSTMRIANGTHLFTEMQYMFDDSFVGLTSPSGGTQFLRVTGVTADPTLPETVLTFSGPIQADPSGGTNPACNFTGFGSGTFEVVPLHFVRYSIQEDALVPGDTLLVREELDGAMGDLNTVSRYVVARNIVDLQVWFDGTVAGGTGEVIADGEGSGDWGDTQGSVSATLSNGGADDQPENLRYAYVQLSARLATPISRDIADDASQGLREWIELRESNGATPAYLNEFTRVVTVRAEVELPNIALAQTTTL